MYRIIIIIMAFLTACSSDKKSATVNVTDPYIPPIITDQDNETDETDEIIEDIGLEGGTKYLVYQDGEQVKFFNGSAVYVGYTGNSTYAGDRIITVNNTLYYMDANGDITEQFSLNIDPDFCVVDLSGNVWTADIIEPEEAYNQGALYKYYLKVYKNNVEYGNWMERQYECVLFFLCGSDIIAISSTGKYYDISGEKQDINSAMGFVIYDFDSDTKTAKIDGINISWSLNFFNSAKQWNGAYSWNGYKWDGTVLTENATVMQCWQLKTNYPITLPENAVLISAGSLIFSGETHYFFIECNSGWLFKYIPSSDTLVQIVRLYTGDGYRDTGLLYADILQPVCSYDSLYFKFSDGGLYRYRFDSGQISFIDFCDGYVKEW